MMRKYSERESVKTAIHNFIANYGNGTYHYGKDKQAGAKLKLLDPETATAEEVNTIIGAPWAVPWCCDECNHSGWDVIEIGDPPDCDSSTAYICQDCLKVALNLSNEEGG
jgi:hypothetical protein